MVSVCAVRNISNQCPMETEDKPIKVEIGNVIIFSSPDVLIALGLKLKESYKVD